MAEKVSQWLIWIGSAMMLLAGVATLGVLIVGLVLCAMLAWKGNCLVTAVIGLFLGGWMIWCVGVLLAPDDGQWF